MTKSKTKNNNINICTLKKIADVIIMVIDAFRNRMQNINTGETLKYRQPIVRTRSEILGIKVLALCVSFTQCRLRLVLVVKWLSTCLYCYRYQVSISASSTIAEIQYFPSKVK